MEQLGYYALYGIPGDHTHSQLSTIGHLTDDDVRGCLKALGQVFGR